MITPLATLLLPLVPGLRTGELPVEVQTWLDEAARPLRTLQVDDEGFDDLGDLGALVGDVPLVLVGEATHGSAEFFRFKHRLFAALVTEHGFTDFVMETDWTRARLANAWVEHGEGDLESALTALGGLWRTEEYRDLLLWMRAWNEENERKVRLHGMDMQLPPGPAAAEAKSFLQQADPELAEVFGPTIDAIGRLAAVDELDLEGVPATFDELEDDLVAATDRDAYELARQCLTVALQRWHQGRLSGLDGTDWRDTCMAENVRWILERAGSKGRVLVSAHNGHVSRDGLTRQAGRTVQSIGRALAADGPPMVVVGAAFAGGGFQALPSGGGPMKTFRLDAPAAGSIEQELAASGLSLALIDLRSAASGPVREWLDTARPSIQVGGLWDPQWATQAGYPRVSALTDEYDALFFVAETSAARPLTP